MAVSDSSFRISVVRRITSAMRVAFSRASVSPEYVRSYQQRSASRTRRNWSTSTVVSVSPTSDSGARSSASITGHGSATSGLDQHAFRRARSSGSLVTSSNEARGARP